jgi:hypothetical protein
MPKSALRELRWVKPTGQVTAKKAAFAPAADAGRADALRAMLLATGVPEPVEDLPVIEEARLLLRAAAEVEHALLVQYLYTLYSVRTTAPRRADLLEITLEEMGHLLTLQNLLLFIGAPPYFDRGQTLLDGMPAGDFAFPLQLEGLSRTALAKYVTAESPGLDQISDPSLRARLEPIIAEAGQAAGRPLNHVGALYAKLFWLFQPTDDPHPLWPELPGELLQQRAAGRHLTAAEFSGREERQADPSEFFQDPVDPTTGENLYIIPVRSRIEALFALDLIAEQGEGLKLGARSHFERFLDHYEHFGTDLAGHLAPVPVNPRTANAGAGQHLITHPAALPWAKLLNVRYQMLLLKLALGLWQPRQTSVGGVLSRSSLFEDALSEMRVGVRRIALRLVGFNQTEIVAGAPFELPAEPLPADVAGLQQGLRAAVHTAGGLLQELQNLPAPHTPTPSELSFLAQMQQADMVLLDALGG